MSEPDLPKLVVGTMDSDPQILHNVREGLGCNGVRNFADLGKLRQSTLERRLTDAHQKLSTTNMLSIYAAWFQDQVDRVDDTERVMAVRKWCDYLSVWDCNGADALHTWELCKQRVLAFEDNWRRERTRQQMDEVAAEIMQATRRRTRLESQRTTRPKIVVRLPPTPYSEPPRPKIMAKLPPRLPTEELHTRTYKEAEDYLTARPPGWRSRVEFGVDLRTDLWAKDASRLHEIQVAHPKAANDLSCRPVPKDYRCRRCGERASHFVESCPTNGDPWYDPPPRKDYVCKACGQVGDHCITVCPDLSQPRPAKPSKRRCSWDDWEHIPVRAKRDDDPMKGRLSPWNETTSSRSLEKPGQNWQGIKPSTTPLSDESISHWSDFYDEPQRGFVKDFLSRIEKHKANNDMNQNCRSFAWSGLSAQAEGAIGSYHVSKKPRVNFSYENMDGDFFMNHDEDDTLEAFDLEREDLELGDVADDAYTISRPGSPIEPYVTNKGLLAGRPYSPLVVGLFIHKGNVWINPRSRPKALDMWPVESEVGNAEMLDTST